MNNTFRNLVRRSLPFVVLAVSSMAISQQANGEDARAVSLAQMEASEALNLQGEAQPVIADEFRFCYQGNELVSCEGAVPERHETNSEGAASPPPMFDINVLLGSSAS